MEIQSIITLYLTKETNYVDSRYYIRKEYFLFLSFVQVHLQHNFEDAGLQTAKTSAVPDFFLKELEIVDLVLIYFLN